jgi:hypothetical protein
MTGKVSAICGVIALEPLGWQKMVRLTEESCGQAWFAHWCRNHPADTPRKLTNLFWAFTMDGTPCLQ